MGCHRAGIRLADAALRLLLLIIAIGAAACSGGDPGVHRPVPLSVARGDSATLLSTLSELSGKEVYLRENCARCHTSFDVPPAEGAFALPSPAEAQGSRVGPDLGTEGHRRSDDWQYAHLYAPASVVPGSPMPAMRHLFLGGTGGAPRPSNEAVSLVAYLQALGRGRRDVWAEFRRSEPEITAPPRADRSLFARGVELYEEQCVSCHGASGDGRGEAAPLLLFPPRDFVAADYRFKSVGAGGAPADADLFRAITMGAGSGAAMPAFYWLPVRDRWALVLRIKEFSPRLRATGLEATPRAAEGPTGPSDGAPAPPGAAPTETGRSLWTDLECARCHGPDARGLVREESGALWADAAGAPVPRSGDLTHACAYRGGASGRAIESAIFGTGLAMPSYGEAVPRGDDRRALRDYVLALQDGPGGR